MAETKNLNQPLVSIGIPAFQRESHIDQAIQSAIAQSYRNLEIIISDNASTDKTLERITTLAKTDARIRFFCQKKNFGPTKNFEFVLRESSGDFFLWLGDDDWIDPNYVEACINQLLNDQKMAVCGGLPIYYREDNTTYPGRTFKIMNGSRLLRTFQYLCQVSDNGIFYGLIRKDWLLNAPIKNRMGWDWILFSSLAYRGRIFTITSVVVHRRLGGATSSYTRIVEVMALPAWNAKFPYLAIIRGLNGELWKNQNAYPGLGFIGKLIYCLVLSSALIWHKTARAIYGQLKKYLGFKLRSRNA